MRTWDCWAFWARFNGHIANELEMTAPLAVVQPPAKMPPADTQAESKWNAVDGSLSVGNWRSRRARPLAASALPRHCAKAGIPHWALRPHSPLFRLTFKPFSSFGSMRGKAQAVDYAERQNQTNYSPLKFQGCSSSLFQIQTAVKNHSNKYPETSLEISQAADAESLQLKLKPLLKIDQNDFALLSFPFNLSYGMVVLFLVLLF